VIFFPTISTYKTSFRRHSGRAQANKEKHKYSDILLRNVSTVTKKRHRGTHGRSSADLNNLARESCAHAFDLRDVRFQFGGHLQIVLFFL
jgi:hypothetical protein